MDRFCCVRCGRCCRWPGEVRLSEDDVRRAAAFLGWTEQEFIERCTRLRRDRSGLALTDVPGSDDCIFFRDAPARCLIQDAKPEQCIGFPERWNFPGWHRECAGHFSGEEGEKR